jgi:rhodanese-related sulfurtransferase
MAVVLSSILMLAAVLGGRASQLQQPSPVDANAVPRVSVVQLQGLVEAGLALVIDVRTAESFAAGHIAGAINVPLPDIEPRARELRDLAGGRSVVAYCSCPDEHASIAAGVILIRHGVPGVSALVGGYSAWVKGGGKTGKRVGS